MPHVRARGSRNGRESASPLWRWPSSRCIPSCRDLARALQPVATAPTAPICRRSDCIVFTVLQESTALISQCCELSPCRLQGGSRALSRFIRVFVHGQQVHTHGATRHPGAALCTTRWPFRRANPWAACRCIDALGVRVLFAALPRATLTAGRHLFAVLCRAAVCCAVPFLEASSVTSKALCLRVVWIIY